MFLPVFLDNNINISWAFSIGQNVCIKQPYQHLTTTLIALDYWVSDEVSNSVSSLGEVHFCLIGF